MKYGRLTKILIFPIVISYIELILITYVIITFLSFDRNDRFQLLEKRVNCVVSQQPQTIAPVLSKRRYMIVLIRSDCKIKEVFLIIGYCNYVSQLLPL